MLCKDVLGLYLGTENCESVCGDSIIVTFTEICDDGNIINGDGYF